MKSAIRVNYKKIAVRKWGNGHGVLLPKAYVDILGLRNSEVKTTLKGNSILVTKIPVQKANLTLRDMVRGMDKKHRHTLIDFGVPRGKELW